MGYKKESFIDILEHYFNYYLPVAKGLSPATIASYKSTFRLLMTYIYSENNISADKITFETIDDRLVTSFLDWLENDRKCCSNTRNQRLSAIVAFSVYAQNRAFGTAAVFRSNVSKVPKKKVPKKGRHSFSREELKILFDLPKTTTEIGLRDKILLCFMYASGTRAQEVCDLTVGDIQFHTDRAGINILGKGQKVRRIGIPSEATQMLHNYIIHRRIESKYDAHVFSSQTHEKMSVSCIEEIYKKYVKKAKTDYSDMFRKNYTPHSMRHTTATHMLEAGVPLIVVKNFLGHVSIQTTQIYTEVSQDTMDRQLMAWNDKWFIKDNLREKKTKNVVPYFLR